MRNKLKKVTALAFMSGLLVTGVMPVSAASGNEEATVVQVAIPDENGVFQFYTGTEAQMIYDELENQTDIEVPEESFVPESVEVEDDNGLMRGMFTYKYRFVQSSSGTKWGTSKRVSTYAGNGTSVQQSKTLNASTSVSWTINTSLSGKFNDAFTASVGSGWQNTSSFSEQFTINVAPKKRVWLEFKPKLKYVNGEAQKYYTTRGPISTTIIEERKSVSSTSPTQVRMTLAGKSFYCPDGAYVWKEDNNYNSN